MSLIYFRSKVLNIELEKCSVGLFNLPGILFKKEDMTPELFEEITAWSEENHCGNPLTEVLWSFRNEAKRDWFILRWG